MTRGTPRRVVTVIQSPIYSGAHNEMARLEAHYRAAGWSSTVILPDQPGDAAARLRAVGVDVVQLPLHRLRATRDPRNVPALFATMPSETAAVARVMKDRGADVARAIGIVHPHAALAGRRLDIAVVWQATDLVAPGPLRALLMPFVVRLSNGMLFNGRTLLREHSRWARIVVPHAAYFPPVDVDLLRPDAARRARSRAALGVGADELLVGTVANLNPDKGLEYLVGAAELVTARSSSVRFVVVGAEYPNHAGYAVSLRDAVARARMDDGRFRFLGPRRDIEEVYAALDLMAISSVSEGTTTTALEAMASGIPIVATDVGAVHEVVTDGVTGRLVPGHDAAALADALLALAADPGQRDRLGAAGRDRAVRRFDARLCADVHIRLFEAALRHHERRGAARP